MTLVPPNVPILVMDGVEEVLYAGVWYTEPLRGECMVRGHVVYSPNQAVSPPVKRKIRGVLASVIVVFQDLE